MFRTIQFISATSGTSLLRTPAYANWRDGRTTTIFRLRTGYCQLLSHMYHLRLYLTQMSAHVELVFKTQNTAYKTVQPTHSKEHACGHLGLTSRTSCGGPRRNFEQMPSSSRTTHLQIWHDHTSIWTQKKNISYWTTSITDERREEERYRLRGYFFVQLIIILLMQIQKIDR